MNSAQQECPYQNTTTGANQSLSVVSHKCPGTTSCLLGFPPHCLRWPLTVWTLLSDFPSNLWYLSSVLGLSSQIMLTLPM